ncbi:MAG: hypothetical protein PUE18_05865, partial [Firmicutes bacterium]|nr:hypothetical protein [Bacillota bacterium]
HKKCKKSVQHGIRDSFAHMSPIKVDLRKVLFLIFRKYRKIDISYIIKRKSGRLPLLDYVASGLIHHLVAVREVL